VRSQVRLGVTHLRRLFWTRPLSDADIARAGERIAEYDEDRALLESAVKANDGFFTTHFVSPYSKYIARWAAHRGWTPNGVTTLSVAIGFAAAAGFATGDRWGLIAGAILLQLAFTFDCVDGQLARYTRTFTKLGAWLDSIFDRTKEYAVFAGLAIGGAGDDIWLLAGAALALQVMRHSIDFSYPAAQHQVLGAVAQPPLEQVMDTVGASAPAAPEVEPEPGEAPPPPPAVTFKQRVRGAWRSLDRSSHAVWVKKIMGFPIGERFAAISITAAIWDARVTFIVMLAWGGFAASYTIAGRVLRSLGRRGPVALNPGTELPTSALDAYRDDGPLALVLGRLRMRALPASALVLAGLVPLLAVIAITGGGASWGLAAAVVAWLVLAAGVSSGRPLRDRMRWIVPPALRVAEYAGILWLAALAGPSAVPGAFALLLAVTYRHYDIVYRLRHRGTTPPVWLNRLSAGWDGRMIAVFVLAAAAAVPAGLYVAAALLGVVFAAETVASWASFERTRQPDVYEDEEEDAE
jgi:phosphatidylglycerophosphate synthase